MVCLTNIEILYYGATVPRIENGEEGRTLNPV